MSRRVFLAVALTVLAATLFVSLAFAQNGVVGVKAGDWIKYKVAETGNPIPEYNITWARMDIINVEGPVITVNVLTQYGNGTLLPENGISLNVATGAIGDGFFVPTNLEPGDQYSTEYEGIINMTSIEHTDAGGASRAVLVGVTSQSVYNWDKQTGIMVSATSTMPGYVMYTTTSATNLWAPQIFDLGQTLSYELTVTIISVVVVLVLVAVILFWRRKKTLVAPSS